MGFCLDSMIIIIIISIIIITIISGISGTYVCLDGPRRHMARTWRAAVAR
jgi:hypothetical protein